MSDKKGFIAVLKNKDYRFMYLGSIISQLGNAFTKVALPFFILEITGSITSMGIILGLQIIPWLLVGPTLNVYLDRYSRKKVLVVISILQCLIMLALPAIRDEKLLYIFAFLMGTGETLWTATKSAVNPDIISKEDYTVALSLNSISYEAMSILAPAIGGILVGIIGFKYVFILDGITFLVLTLFVLPINIPKRNINKKENNFVKEFKVGFNFLLENPIVKFNIYIILAECFLLALFDSNLIVFVKEIVKLGTEWYGFVLTVRSCGAIIGGVLINKLETKLKRYHLLVGGAIIQGLVLIPLGWVNGIYIVFIVWFLYGIFNSIADITTNIYLAEETPRDIRGRVYSTVNAISQGTAAVGSWAIGPTVWFMGSRNVFLIGGSLLGVLVLSLLKTPIYSKIKGLPEQSVG